MRRIRPANAKVKGRVRRLERYSAKEGGGFAVVFEFTDFDSDRFFADFETVDRAQECRGRRRSGLTARLEKTALQA
jgi:hypothetical protein